MCNKSFFFFVMRGLAGWLVFGWWGWEGRESKLSEGWGIEEQEGEVLVDEFEEVDGDFADGMVI